MSCVLSVCLSLVMCLLIVDFGRLSWCVVVDMLLVFIVCMNR